MIKNAKTLPKIYYGLHMVEGLAEYKEPEINDGKPYRIFVGEQAIKNMDATFAGRPLFVHHVDEVNLENIQHEADGYVVESFFNKLDGKHWAKFIAVSDRAHEAIASGWRLSNAYVPKSFSGGGLCHGVEYTKEVLSGEYEHLAIVPNPRYEESIILTPEQFQEYNNNKELELRKVANSKESKGARMSLLNIFKKSKVETPELEGATVTLPKSGKEVTLEKLVNDMDEMEMNKAKNEEVKDKPAPEVKEAKEVPLANGDHHVMVGEEKMTVNELVAKHLEMMKPKNEDASNQEAKDSGSLPGSGDIAGVKANEEKEPEEKEVKKNAFETLKNAPFAIVDKQGMELGIDKVVRGKSRYGSK